MRIYSQDARNSYFRNVLHHFAKKEGVKKFLSPFQKGGIFLIYHNFLN